MTASFTIHDLQSMALVVLEVYCNIVLTLSTEGKSKLLSHVFSGDPGVSEHTEVRGQFKLSSPILEAGPLLTK